MFQLLLKKFELTVSARKLSDFKLIVLLGILNRWLRDGRSEPLSFILHELIGALALS